MINRVVQGGRVILQGMNSQFAVVYDNGDKQEIVNIQKNPYRRHQERVTVREQIAEGLVEYKQRLI